MAETIGRTFYFEKSLWSRLDDDAKRCGRSSVKQLEAILKTYYSVGDVELKKESLEILGVMSGASKLERPLLETSEPAQAKPKRKKAA